MPTKSTTKEEFSFSVSYDAKNTSLEKHIIQANILANSILSANNIIEEAHKELTGLSSPSPLMIQAPIKKGSVIIDFYIYLTEMQISVQQAIALIGFVPGLSIAKAAKDSLFDFLKENGNSSIITARQSKSNIDAIDLEMIDEHQKKYTITISKNVAKLIFNKRIRKDISKLFYAPAANYQDIKITLNSNNTKYIISSLEAQKFKWRAGSLPTIEALDKTLICDVEFDIVAFGEDKKWKINYNDKSVWVEILDLDFLDKVSKKQITFTKGKLFQVELTIKTQNPFTLDAKDVYFIEKVMGSPTSRQMNLID